KVIYEDYINKKKDFFKDCPMSDLRSVLKANDYACTAFATAHLLANIPPYTYLSWETKEEVVMPEQKYDPKSAEKPGQKPKSGPARIRHRAVQVTKNALEEVANRATESKPASAADYASAIWNFQGDPLPRDEIRKMAMGKMYLNIIDRLLDSTIADPKITSIRLGHIYELLQREVNQPGLFTEYTAEDVKRLRPAYRR
ncbi:MAG: hypothetical protein NTW67_01315, partial [Candidatus Woesearchaeota archaeon]|nr:hypothetical protein [Candidatus Woesearchaeota archaeon]